jgi:beta-lactamase class A
MNRRYEFGVSWWWGALVLILGVFFFAGRPRKEAQAMPVLPTTDARWDLMVANIQSTVERYNGDVGIYIKNLKNGRSYEYNVDHEFVCASLIKLPIMAATFEAIKEGKISLNTRIKFKSNCRRDGSGTLKWARSGVYYPLSYLIYQMITKSDNTATALIIDQLGYDYLNRQFESLGLQATRIAPTGMSLASRLADPALDNYTTPREMGNLLEKIYKHQVVSDGLSDLMLEIMKGANHRTRLAKDLPRDWQFARKTGLLRKNCHDVGIVFSPEGDFVICVLTNGRTQNYKVAKGLISSVGRKAYEYMSQSSI